VSTSAGKTSAKTWPTYANVTSNTENTNNDHHQVLFVRCVFMSGLPVTAGASPLTAPLRSYLARSAGMPKPR
jgi:hypothetical protein